MLRYKKTIQVVILLAVVVISAFTLISGLFNKNGNPDIGDKAPDFTLRELGGDESSLSDYMGKVVIVNFWGTYCPPCVREMPLIQSYYEQYKEKGVVVLAVNENDPLVSIKAFIRQYKLTFPILLDKDTVRKQYGVTEYPTTFILDTKGKIAYKQVGEINESFIRGALTKLVKQ